MHNRYYKWLISQVSDKHYDARYYSKLLKDLDSIAFTWIMELDENRVSDAYTMRNDCGYVDDQPVSVLEIMVALARRVEPEYLEEGGAIPFFWGMIKSLGLYFNDDYHYDAELTQTVVSKFLDRDYRSDGKGGLFTLLNPRENMRTVQIWQQAMWYLNELYYENDRGWI